MALAKAAAKAFQQFATAENKVAQISQELGSLLARPFVAAGLHRTIASEAEATVAFERLAALLSDEKEMSAFRNEVAKRSLSEGHTKQRKKRAVKGKIKSGTNSTVVAA